MEEHGRIRRRRLPHWDLPGATYFITTCLEGSIPTRGKLDLARLRGALAPSGPGDAAAARTELWKRLFSRSDWWLDRQPAVRHLADPVLAGVVADACYHWAGHHYDLLAYVVMPSHLHWVFRPLEPVPAERAEALPNKHTPREYIMHSLKRHTALQCNRRLGRQGKFWQAESYDHCVRDDAELERIISYVEQNPLKAGLVATAEEWAFSSAKDRAANGVLVGHPLTRRA